MKELLTFFEIQVTLMFWGQMGCNYMFILKKTRSGVHSGKCVRGPTK
jgi:hypothetical protein